MTGQFVWTIRRLHDTYDWAGVRIAWHARNHMLGNERPCELWHTNPDAVEAWAESLGGQIAT